IWLLAVASLLIRQMLTMFHPNKNSIALGTEYSVLSTRHSIPIELPQRAKQTTLRRLIILGALTGFAYTIDMAAGPLLFLCVLGWLIVRTWPASGWPDLLLTWTCFLAPALPWLFLHHAIVYSIAGTIGPPGSVAAYLDWPGSPFHAGNITGHWQHPSVT